MQRQIPQAHSAHLILEGGQCNSSRGKDHHNHSYKFRIRTLISMVLIVWILVDIWKARKKFTIVPKHI